MRTRLPRAKQFGKKITGIYITHGHSDHWLGLARLLEHFPEALGYAAPEVAGRPAWEAEFNKTSKYWTSRFPGELPEPAVVPEVYASDEILVDGQLVNIIHVGQGDVEGSTIFHVPSAEAVVCGDVVYNNVHMMMYEADEAKREAWIASIDAVAALNPKIVVAGHKSVGAPDLPENLAASRRYLRDFTAVSNRGGTVEDLVHGMLELHGERDQPHTLWISARAEVARRA
jgi:glyoxylase-like metal-dependent hydrolase (beta-lactamase superfamily II)